MPTTSTPRDPAPDPESSQEDPTSAEDVEAQGPLDADEGDPQLDAYPG